MSRKRKVIIFKQDFIAESIHDNEIKIKGYKLSETIYNAEGNILTEEKYSPDGFVEVKEKNVYDEQGKLIEEINYFDEDTVADHITYKRNHDGKIISGNKHYEDGSKDEIKYQYNAEGKLTEKIIIDEDGDMEAKDEYIYEGKLLIKKASYEADEKISETIYQYDENGKRSISEEKDLIDEYRIVYHLNPEGNVIKTLKYNYRNELIEKSVLEYNKKGYNTRVIMESTEHYHISDFVYDENGNAIEQIEKDKNGETIGHVKRNFNDNNDVLKTEVFLDFQGRGINQHYILNYEYEDLE